MQLAARHAEVRERLDVFGVLHELGVGASRRQPLEAVDGEALGEWVVTLRVQAVHRVDDDRDARRAGRESAVHAGLGIVGVDDVGTQPLEVVVQLGPGPDIAAEGDRSAGVLDRLERDPARRDRVRVGARCRHGDHVVARLGEGLELRPQQQLQGDVGRRHVHDDGPSAHVVTPR